MRFLRSELLLGLFCMMLASCMMGPNYHTSRAPQTDRYTETPQPQKTASTKSAGKAGKAQQFVSGLDIPAAWWELFHSEAINQLIQQGIDNSPNLIAAQATLREAQEAVNAQIGSSLYPQVSGSLTGERQRLSLATFGQSGNTLFNLYNASIPVTYTLDVFGSARRQIEALGAQVDYEQYELDATYIALTSNIVTTTITAASLQAQIKATQEIIQLLENQLTIVSKQFHLGGAAGSDVLTQESQLAQARATLPPLEQSLAQTRHALAVLVGVLPSEFTLPDIRLEKIVLPVTIPVSVPSELVRHRPDIQASEALLHAANAQIGVAIANQYPQISLSGSYGWENTAPSQLFKSKSIAWNYSGGLTQPIFNGGALVAKKRGAIDAYKAAEAQYHQTVLQAFQNVADTLCALENDAKTLRAKKQAEIAARDALHIIQKQYRVGGVSYLSLLTAQKQYQQTLISRVQAQAQRYTDTAALFQAMGGGWWNT